MGTPGASSNQGCPELGLIAEPPRRPLRRGPHRDQHDSQDAGRSGPKVFWLRTWHRISSDSVTRRQAILPIASIFGYPGEQIGESVAERRRNRSPHLSRKVSKRNLALVSDEIVVPRRLPLARDAAISFLAIGRLIGQLQQTGGLKQSSPTTKS